MHKPTPRRAIRSAIHGHSSVAGGIDNRFDENLRFLALGPAQLLLAKQHFLSARGRCCRGGVGGTSDFERRRPNEHCTSHIRP